MFFNLNLRLLFWSCSFILRSEVEFKSFQHISMCLKTLTPPPPNLIVAQIQFGHIKRAIFNLQNALRFVKYLIFLRESRRVSLSTFRHLNKELLLDLRGGGLWQEMSFISLLTFVVIKNVHSYCERSQGHLIKWLMQCCFCTNLTIITKFHLFRIH